MKNIYKIEAGEAHDEAMREQGRREERERITEMLRGWPRERNGDLTDIIRVIILSGKE